MVGIITVFEGESAHKNTEIKLLYDAARTLTTERDDKTNYNCSKGAILCVNVSAIVATPVLTPKLQIKDPATGNYLDIWIAAANLTAAGKSTYLFGLGGSGAAGEYLEAVNILLSRVFRFQMIHADADSATYSAAIILLV